MRVEGISDDRCYRVSFEHGARVIRGLIPESMVADQMGLPPRPPHGAVYEWIAANTARIEKTLIALDRGTPARPRPPFDALALSEET